MTLDLGDDADREIVSLVVVKRDVRAFARQHVAERGANAARAAGYEGALTFEQ